jgi:hypothetical protein
VSAAEKIGDFKKRYEFVEGLPLNDSHPQSRESFMRVLVSEYPKSGGTWIVSLIGDALGLPKRDLYHFGAGPAELRKHLWYAGASDFGFKGSCVIKSHEYPTSRFVQFSAKQIHLVRDGRDVVVSKYFFDRDFCVANGIYERFEESFDTYVSRVSAEWNEFVLSWLNVNVPCIKYEDFLHSPLETLECALSSMGIESSRASMHFAVGNNTKDRIQASIAPLYPKSSFVRKGVSGDWRSHFQQRHLDAFKEVAREAMERLGYDW